MSIAGQTLERVRELLHRHSGFELPEWVVAARVGERLEALGLSRADRYLSLISQSAGRRELDLLVEALRVGETSFFRHRAQMDAIADMTVPELVATKKRRVRVWSAGCASGEEPYSVAILLRRALPPSVELSVLASDISLEALEVAKRGVYSRKALERVPSALRSWAFEPFEGDSAVVKSEISSLVRFEHRNLAEGDFPGGFDLVLCRNVLIYFSREARDKVVGGLLRSVNRDGYLVVGYAESLRGVEELDAQRAPDAVIYRRTTPPLRMPARLESPPRSEGRTASVPLDGQDSEARAAVIELKGRYEDGDERLADELSQALSGEYQHVVIDVDGADFLGDDAGRTLRRALSAAFGSDVVVKVEARRSGAQRWLRRQGISVEPHQ